MNKKFFACIIAFLLAMPVMAQFGSLSPLHVEGKHLKDTLGNTVVLHGVMDTPSPYFNSYRWGNRCDGTTINQCVAYFDQLFTAMTDTVQGAYCNLFRLHLDPCWTNDPKKQSTGTETGEANISRFSESRLRILMNSLFFPIIRKAMGHGLYVIMRPPGVCPHDLRVGDYYQEYLLKVWDIVSQNTSVLANAGVVSIELANEPVNVYAADGQKSDRALHDYFQPIVDKIRANGFKGIIWVPGTGWQSGYQSYARYPITGDNIGYAVHDYPGWYNSSDANPNRQGVLNQFKNQVPVVETNPIVITEVDWSPEVEGKGHYDEHGNWVVANMGTWATATTSKWGVAYKDLIDYYGNISMTLSGTSCLIDIDEYRRSGIVKPAFNGAVEACGRACMDWYKDYALMPQSLIGTGGTNNITMSRLTIDTPQLTLKPGERHRVTIKSTALSGFVSTVTTGCRFRSSDPAIADYDNGYIVAKSEGDTKVRFSYTDGTGHTKLVEVKVTVSNTTGITELSSDEQNKVYYSLDGTKRAMPRKGINLMKENNRVRKIWLK